MTMTRSRKAATSVLALLSLVAALGCSRSASAPTPPPQERLEAAAKRMAALTSLRFTLTHEQGRTPLLAGIEAQRAEGAVALPDQASLQVEAVVTGVGAFISLSILVKGAEVSMTDPLTGAWRPLPAGSLPFNFLDLGLTLASIARAIQSPAYTSREVIGGVASQGIRGSVTGKQLASLVPSATPTATAGIEVWVGEDNLIRRVRLTGPVVPKDSPEVVRVLSFTAFDQPVTIALPR